MFEKPLHTLHEMQLLLIEKPRRMSVHRGKSLEDQHAGQKTLSIQVLPTLQQIVHVHPHLPLDRLLRDPSVQELECLSRILGTCSDVGYGFKLERHHLDELEDLLVFVESLGSPANEALQSFFFKFRFLKFFLSPTPVCAEAEKASANSAKHAAGRHADWPKRHREKPHHAGAEDRGLVAHLLVGLVVDGLEEVLVEDAHLVDLGRRPHAVEGVAVILATSVETANGKFALRYSTKAGASATKHGLFAGGMKAPRGRIAGGRAPCARRPRRLLWALGMGLPAQV
mmetsp:Transcript_140465/g.448926  ORF Transcript_140465/g.448926 Transcript_140465/m.448926 type:complete len:284 (+) Transcript_140465:388-1239(+)